MIDFFLSRVQLPFVVGGLLGLNLLIVDASGSLKPEKNDVEGGGVFGWLERMDVPPGFAVRIVDAFIAA